MKKVTVWVVTGESESSDRYGPAIFSKKPSDKILSELAHSWDGSEEKDGGGYDNSYVYLSLREVIVDEALESHD